MRNCVNCPNERKPYFHHRGARETGSRAESPHFCLLECNRTGRHLPSLQAQTKNPSRGCTCQRTGTAGPLAHDAKGKQPCCKIRNFVKGEVKDEEDALKGARDILAEQISEDERSRNLMRNQFQRQALIQSKVVKGKEAEEASAKYRDYFDFCEPLKKCSSHRLLALRRGESEGVLKVSIFPEDEDMCNERLQRLFVRANNECAHQVEEALTDGYKRLLKPAIETEFAALSKEKADEEAIRVFAENLRQLLLALSGTETGDGIDPGFRTGCKVVCLDAQGTLLHNEAIYPTRPNLSMHRRPERL